MEYKTNESSVKKHTVIFGGIRFEYKECENIFISIEPGKKGFDYSDGDEVEQRIHKIVTSISNKEVFSEELASHITDWPTEYHLSPRRGNILRVIDTIKPGSRVLELGCGCGAITRYLAEIGCYIDAVEGSHTRARIAGERVRELSNASVYNADFSNLKLEKEYDYVALIGVLEYAPKFFDTDNPIVTCLELASGALKSDGKLVVAIGNQLGVKYFAGLPEDHHSKAYYGVEGRYADKQVVTYGKKELSEILEKTGFKTIDFSYPYPDYKLPQIVVTEAGANSSDLNVSDLIYSSLLRSNERKPVFDISSTCKVLEKNGLIGELSNSFLVVACLDENEKSINENTLAEIYTDNRKPRFNTKTRIGFENKEVVVSKSHLLSDGNKKVDFHSIGGTEKYIEGEVLEVKVCEYLKKYQHDKAYAILSMWVEYLKTISTDSRLPGRYVDAIPRNFIVDHGGRLHLIDDEWCFDEYVDYLLVVFRGIRSIVKNEHAEPYLEGVGEEARIRAISKRLGLEKGFSRHWEEAVSYDKYLGELVYGGGKWIISYKPKTKNTPYLVEIKRLIRLVLQKTRLFGIVVKLKKR